MTGLPTAPRLERRLHALADPVRRQTLQWFFKTGPGQYAEGDRFLGVTVPQVRRLAVEHADTPLGDIESLLASGWHEARMLGLVLLANRYGKADRTTQVAIYRLYMSNTARINNWDLVDISAPAVVGAHLLTRSRSVLRRLARSRTLWERRIAVIATFTFIRHGQFTDTLSLAEQLMDDPHDLMHKAIGWMLREVGKRDEQALRTFLDRHAARMPRTMLRYALERLRAADRVRYMGMKRNTA